MCGAERTVRLARGNSGTLKVCSPRTQRFGMIEQGRLDSVLRFCNKHVYCPCSAHHPVRPVRPWSPPWLFGCLVAIMPQPPKDWCATVVALIFISGSWPEQEPTWQEWIDNPQCCSALQGLLAASTRGTHAQPLQKVGPPPPIKCSVCRWAKVHLTISLQSSDEETGEKSLLA